MFFTISNIKPLIKCSIKHGLSSTVYEEMPRQEHWDFNVFSEMHFCLKMLRIHKPTTSEG
jgi:hypothetical protein